LTPILVEPCAGKWTRGGLRLSLCTRRGTKKVLILSIFSGKMIEKI
jgi:hypothetical protein